MDVETRIDGRAGRIVLNRPAALNALNQPMIRDLTAALRAWRNDPAVHLVLIEGAGGRAFCAGGDIRALRDASLAGDPATIEAFFSEEYALNLMIAEYPKPYVALIDGVCMGGGIGLSVHAPYRVATEEALFAMPETGIALFPDVGASYALPRLPGALGMFLGLTGHRLKGADGVHAGFASHFVPRAELPALAAALSADGIASLPRVAAPLPAFSLEGVRPAIDRVFSAPSVDEMLERLAGEGAWGEGVAATLRAASPSSVLWTHEILRRGAGSSLAAALQAELHLTRAVTRHPDFAEGVRAMVVDKDRKPNWSPASLEAVDRGAIAAMFGAGFAG